MSYSYPAQYQSPYPENLSTPPPPPPKPSTHNSGHATPQGGPSQRPGSYHQPQYYPYSQPPEHHPQHLQSRNNDPVPQNDVAAPPAEGWLPPILLDKSKQDLTAVLSSPALQSALLTSPSTAHPSLLASTAHLTASLTANASLASHLLTLESQLTNRRDAVSTHLLQLHTLERAWRTKQEEVERALQSWSPQSLYQRLGAAVVEGEREARGIEESFLEAEGCAGEREVAAWVGRVRECRRLGALRAERKERWDEGRVGGWR